MFFTTVFQSDEQSQLISALSDFRTAILLSYYYKEISLSLREVALNDITMRICWFNASWARGLATNH